MNTARLLLKIRITCVNSERIAESNVSNELLKINHTWRPIHFKIEINCNAPDGFIGNEFATASPII